jgi:ankyrin repeat protein
MLLLSTSWLLSRGSGFDANDSNGTTTILGKRKSRGANTKKKGCDGDTALHLASMKGRRLAIVLALLSGGADILAASNQGELPIHLVALWGKSEMTKHPLQQFYATTSRLHLNELLKDLTFDGNPNSSNNPPVRPPLHRDLLGMDDNVVEILQVSRWPKPCIAKFS